MVQVQAAMSESFFAGSSVWIVNTWVPTGRPLRSTVGVEKNARSRFARSRAHDVPLSPSSFSFAEIVNVMLVLVVVPPFGMVEPTVVMGGVVSTVHLNDVVFLFESVSVAVTFKV